MDLALGFLRFLLYEGKQDRSVIVVDDGLAEGGTMSIQQLLFLGFNEE